MAQDFFSLLTLRGRQKLAAALAGGQPVQLTEMAVGDGRNGAYYNPSETQVALEHEAFRAGINMLYPDPDNPAWAVAELVIPDEVGGFYVREVGVFDADGELFAIGKFPESFKPVLDSGSGKQLYVRQIMEVSNAQSVTLIIDPSIVMASREFVDQQIAAASDAIKGRIDRMDFKNSVRAATTANIVLAGLQTLDGIALAAGDRALVKNQDDGRTNGIYAIAVGAWSRASDADTSVKVSPGLVVSVEEGERFGGSQWQLVTPAPITLNATALRWEMASGRTGVSANGYNKVIVDARGRVVGGENIKVAQFFANGQPLPDQDIGPIWHDDYNDWMNWQVFDKNGAAYEGYASRLVGSPILDAQPTARAGYIASGAANLSKTAYAALWNWAVHHGLLVAAGVWVAGTVRVKDNGNGTFAVYDLRGEFIRAWDNGRGADPGRAFGSAQGDAIRNITGGIYSNTIVSGSGAFRSYGGGTQISTGVIPSSTNAVNFDASRVVPTADENRPRNVALPAYVKF
jgi:phage-related tail fiber protein